MNKLKMIPQHNPDLVEVLREVFREELSRIYPEKRYLRPMEAARMMGIGRTSIYKLMRDGSIPFSTWDDDSIFRIDRKDIERVFEERKNI